MPGQRFDGEVTEPLADGRPQLHLDDLPHRGEGEGLDGVLEPGQSRRVVGREQVEARQKRFPSLMKVGPMR